MNQPSFTLWPWKILSIAVPAIAIGALLLAQERRDSAEALSIFFSILAAGNAYLFALATGDFGRVIYAIPLGAIAGFLAISCLTYSLIAIPFELCLALIVFAGLKSKSEDTAVGCALMLGLILLYLTLNHLHVPDETACILSYTLICGVIAACMPLYGTVDGILAAFVAGTRAGMRGTLAAALSLFILLPISESFYISKSMDAETARRIIVFKIIAVWVLPCLIANYYCVKYVFTVVHRVLPVAGNGAMPSETNARGGLLDDIEKS